MVDREQLGSKTLGGGREKNTSTTSTRRQEESLHLPWVSRRLVASGVPLGSVFGYETKGNHGFRRRGGVPL